MVKWTDGFTGTQSSVLHIETSFPTATAAPRLERLVQPPVRRRDQRHLFSGIASCTSTTYSAPGTTSATVAGTCVDSAGKSVSVVSAPFAYDATPPTLTANANPGDHARDAAGSGASTTIAATPGPRLLAPAPNAHVTAPTMLSWIAAPGATYDNVQLFRADPGQGAQPVARPRHRAASP